MENWKVFKEHDWQVGRPDRDGTFIKISVGTTKWLVSDLGNVKREHYNEEGVLKSTFDVKQHWKGRKDSTFKLLGIPTGEYVNRLVAIQFVANPEGYKYVEHIDGDRENNTADNLRWTNKPRRQTGPRIEKN
jgi:hypothetical protein